MTDELDAIAVVGISCRFPGAEGLDAWWALVRDARVATRRFTAEELHAAGVPPRRTAHPGFVPVRAPITDADRFDPVAFGMSPREAAITDPQHRLFLECAVHALEDAAIVPERFDGTIGVFGGCSPDTWLVHLLTHAREEWEAVGDVSAVIGTDKDHLATRVAYKLGLTGPALTVGTACSTGLVAVHLAVQALLTWQCDAALAGAASLAVPFVDGHLHQEGGILSPDGACRPFDADAAGTLSGDGVAVVVLRRLADALRDGDPIHAVIRGSAVNNDGAGKVGYTAPSVDGQRRVVEAALAFAGIDPASVGLVAAHGTGTAIGDPVEVAALQAVYPRAALHSVKANIGHSNTAAGMASLLAAVGALRHGTIPPQANFRTLNPAIDLGGCRVPTAPEPWPSPRRAGVSALGVGGTNAHLVLEEAPARPRVASEDRQLLPLSAHTESALAATAARLADWLAAHPEAPLQDVAATLRERRMARPLRAAWAGTRAELVASLRGPPIARGTARPRRPVFVFAGQGSLRADEPPAELRADLDRCATILGRPLFAGDLHDPRVEQPALFALGWASARRWIAEGVEPACLVGHSGGEIVAAAVGGWLSLEDALTFCVRRAELLATVEPGAMLHVVATPEELGPLLGEGAWISLHNGPRATVVTGTAAAIEALAPRLTAAGLAHQRVRARFPAHSPLLAPLVPALLDARLAARAGRIPVVSCVDGQPLGARAADPAHWARHLAEPVDIGAVLRGLGDDVVVIEAGPARSVRGLVQLNLPDVPVVSSGPSRHAEAWVHGLPIPPVDGRPISLPGYAFDRVRCWVGPPLTPGRTPVAAPPRPMRHPRPPLPVAYRAPATADEAALVDVCEGLLGIDGIGLDDDFFSLGGDSLITLRLMEEVERRLGRKLPASAAYSGLTVARIAPLLGEDPAKPVEDPVLVPFRTTGRRPPFFFAHPLTGVVFPYLPLSRALGDDQPFYGLQAAHLDGGGRHDRTVEEMADRYFAVIRKVQPHGPYFLGGYSFGALIAYELALRCERAGEPVGMLALVDEAAPVDGHRPGLGTFLKLFVGESGRNFARHFQDYAFLARRDAPAARRRDALSRVLHRSALAALVPPDTWSFTLGQASVDRLAFLLVEHMRATYAYAPGPFAGAATVFTSDWTRDTFGADRPERATLGWNRLVRGPLDVRHCAGDHLGMLRDPHAQVLARQLRAAMESREREA